MENMSDDAHTTLHGTFLDSPRLHDHSSTSAKGVKLYVSIEPGILFGSLVPCANTLCFSCQVVKHMKPQEGRPGQKVMVEMPVHVSNVRLLHPVTGWVIPVTSICIEASVSMM